APEQELEHSAVALLYAREEPRIIEIGARPEESALQLYGRRFLFDQIYAFECEVTERALYEAFNVLAHRNDGQRVVDRGPRSFTLEDDLSFLVEARTLVNFAGFLGLHHEAVELFVAPLSAVVAAHGLTAQQGVQEVVRVAVVTGPAQHHSAVTVFSL